MNDGWILHVEDEETDVFLLQLAFQRAAITNPVQVATDGRMAMDYLAGAGEFADRQKYPPPCLVLLDLKLPKVGGLEVLAWIRKHPDLGKLVVIVLSSSAHPDDVERAYALGVNSFIQKPSDLDRTREMVQLLKGWWLGYNQYAPIGGGR